MPICCLCGKKAKHWILYDNNIICTDEVHNIETIKDPIIKAYLITLYNVVE